MRKNEEDHNDSVKQKCLFKIQLRTTCTFSCYSRKHAYAKCLYHMYWSIFQHIKTAGWTKENHVEIPSCTKRHSNGHSFNWYCIKVKDICSLFNEFILKNHDPGMSKKSSKDPQIMQIFVIFSCCCHSN